jgi:cytochrome c553
MSKLVFAFLALASALSAQAAGNAKSGQELTKAKACVTCHGEQGNKPSAPDQPVLAGQHYDYLVKALSDYKNGHRSNPIMKGFAGQLSKQDIEDLAAWFSSQKTTTLHDQR